MGLCITAFYLGFVSSANGHAPHITYIAGTRAANKL